MVFVKPVFGPLYRLGSIAPTVLKLHVLTAAKTFFMIFTFFVWCRFYYSYVQLCSVMCSYVPICAVMCGGAPVRLFNVNYPAREGLRPYGPKTAATINNFNWSSKLMAFRARQRFSVLLRPLWFPFGSNMQAPSNPGAAIATPKVTRQFVFFKWPAVTRRGDPLRAC